LFQFLSVRFVPCEFVNEKSGAGTLTVAASNAVTVEQAKQNNQTYIPHIAGGINSNYLSGVFATTGVGI
jgi:hypothetical protein